MAHPGRLYNFLSICRSCRTPTRGQARFPEGAWHKRFNAAKNGRRTNDSRMVTLSARRTSLWESWDGRWSRRKRTSFLAPKLRVAAEQQSIAGHCFAPALSSRAKDASIFLGVLGKRRAKRLQYIALTMSDQVCCREEKRAVDRRFDLLASILVSTQRRQYGKNSTHPWIAHQHVVDTFMRFGPMPGSGNVLEETCPRQRPIELLVDLRSKSAK